MRHVLPAPHFHACCCWYTTTAAPRCVNLCIVQVDPDAPNPQQPVNRSFLVRGQSGLLHDQGSILLSSVQLCGRCLISQSQLLQTVCRSGHMSLIACVLLRLNLACLQHWLVINIAGQDLGKNETLLPYRPPVSVLDMHDSVTCLPMGLSAYACHPAISIGMSAATICRAQLLDPNNSPGPTQFLKSAALMQFS